MREHNLYVVPYSAADEGESSGGMADLDNLLNQMDSEGGADQANDDSGGQNDTQAHNDQSGEDTQAKDTQTKHDAEDKRNYAFGQMRTQINQLTELLGRVAKANGVEYTDNKDLLAKLNDDTIEKMAKKQNVPVELLREVEALRQDSAAFKAQQLRDAAAIGFQNVMNTYGLTQEELKAFAVELDQAGKNPFMQPIDVVAEYKLLHYDDILNTAVKKAVEEALKKDSAANQSSSTPSTQRGSGGEGAKITTIAGLSALLDEMK